MRIAPQAWQFVVPAVAAGALGLWLMGRPSTVLPRALLSYGRISSPGDGVVLSVAREGPGDVMTCRIFLSVFDVHIQRAPCTGRVTKVAEVPGSFAAAMKDAARGNYRVVMTIEPEGGRELLVVEQISGLIARRIECWRNVGDIVAA